MADNARAAAATGASSQLQVAFFAVLTAEVLQASPTRLGEGTVVRLGCTLLLPGGPCSVSGTRKLVRILQVRVLRVAGAAAAKRACRTGQGRGH